MRDIGIKKICKVLKNDVSAETLEQIVDVLLQGSEASTESDSDNNANDTINLMVWLQEIITFDRFSLTVRLLDAALLNRVVVWLDAYRGDDLANLQLIRKAFTP